MKLNMNRTSWCIGFFVWVSGPHFACTQKNDNGSDRPTRTPETTTDYTIISFSEENGGTLRELFGVVGGPTSQTTKRGTLDTCDVTALLHDYGIRQIRHNDMGNDRGDLEGIVNCSGAPYTACPGSGRYPCWEGCDPSRFEDYLFFDDTDELYDSMVYPSSGSPFEVMLRIGGSMHSEIHVLGKSSTGADHKGPQNDDEYDTWMRGAVALAERYLPGGAHAYPAGSIPYIDIITETNSPKAGPAKAFYDSGAWAHRPFQAFWADAYQKIKPVAGSAKVGGPGFSGQFAHSLATMTSCPAYASLDEAGRVAVDFMQELHERGIVPDWLDWHIFTNDPRHARDAAKKFLEFKDCTGIFAPDSCPWCTWGGDFTATEVIVGAYSFGYHGAPDKGWGDSTCDNKLRYDPANPSSHVDTCDELNVYARGAAVLTADWIALQLSQAVTRAYIYRGSPFSKTDVDSMAITGCESATVTRQKGTGAGIRLWSRMYDGGYRKLYTVATASVNSDEYGLWVLAGKNPSTGGRAVLLSNTASTGRDYSLEFPDLSECTASSVTVHEVKNTGTTSYPQTTDGKMGTPFTCNAQHPHLYIGPYQTQLVILTP